MAALLAVRRRHPRWGAKKLLAVVKRRRIARAAWPSRSTVCDVLRRHALVVPRPRRRPMPHGGHALAPITAPNETWTTDFKGEFRTGDRRYCYPLTLRDGFSRYVLRCDALLSRSYALTRARLRTEPLPTTGCRCAFAVTTGARLLDLGWGGCRGSTSGGCGLGIVPERIGLGPTRAERVARTIPSRAQSGHHAPTSGDCPRAATPLRRVLSGVQRGAAPRELATISHPPRRYTAVAPSVADPLGAARISGAHGGAPRVERRVHLWRGIPIFLTEVLEGEDVGFEEVADGLLDPVLRHGPTGAVR